MAQTGHGHLLDYCLQQLLDSAADDITMDFKKSIIFRCTRGIQYFCSFALKARSTTLIFVECITFHQTSLLDDVHKVLAVFNGHKLCFWYVLVYPSYT